MEQKKFDSDVSESAIEKQLLDAIHAWNTENDKTKLQALRGLLNGQAEQQFISAVRPLLVSPASDRPADNSSLPAKVKFSGPATEATKSLELRKQLSGLRQKIGERGVLPEDMPLAIAFCMFCEALGIKVTSPSQPSAYTSEDFERKSKRPNKAKKKRKKRGGSVWTVEGGAPGLQQTRAKLKY